MTKSNPTAAFRLAVVLPLSLLYFGLAILGRGGFRAFFAQPALTALAVTLLLLVIASFFAGGNLSRGVREDRGNRWVLVPFIGIGLLLGWLPAWSDRENFLSLDGETVRWMGVVLFVLGGILRIGAVFVLGNRFSGLVAIQPGHRLVTTGLYRVIRHPSYLGLLVNSLGWSLAFRSGIGVILVALLIPPLLARIRSEEALLREEFGQEYQAYCRRTARLVPGLY